ncbi:MULTISPECIES: hypothetical protein [Parvimonas]|jgi:hypothetical protein|uniref:hypothetical protein n=1 Tax=Parvimonas TaxID=543311 RepID=UPI00123C0366|nr:MULTISPECIES: hypothetical protein [Parvimonas]MCZ7409253.1 hypothetical protein [Parvimonas micra]MEB3029593.1 hypothetical protein [Parvimonas micra]MEB3058788.1 hypothetical protein [Parvimonas sp. D9]MEB3060949.1 hypothetical protein [Parvimonas micra]MEB3067068.1 hypothetical protein [Parvimonas micra]
MKKKIIALGSVLILVFGIFIFKNFYMNDKNVKNENSGSNSVTEKKSANNDSKKDSNSKESDSKKSNSDEKLTLENLKSQKKVMVLDFSQNG